MALTVYRRPLTTVSSFNYLGRFLLASDNDWSAVIWNLRRAQQKWAYLSQVIGWYGADAWMSGNFYTRVLQVVLLYGSKYWVVSLRIWKALESIQH